MFLLSRDLLRSYAEQGESREVGRGDTATPAMSGKKGKRRLSFAEAPGENRPRGRLNWQNIDPRRTGLGGESAELPSDPFGSDTDLGIADRQHREGLNRHVLASGILTAPATQGAAVQPPRSELRQDFADRDACADQGCAGICRQPMRQDDQFG